MASRAGARSPAPPTDLCIRLMDNSEEVLTTIRYLINNELSVVSIDIFDSDSCCSNQKAIVSVLSTISVAVISFSI